MKAAVICVVQDYASRPYKMASSGMPPPADRVCYVAVLDKPWDLISLEIDVGCCLYIYKGSNIQDRHLARIIKPLGAGELVSFPRSSNSHGHCWRGRVYTLVLEKHAWTPWKTHKRCSLHARHCIQDTHATDKASELGCLNAVPFEIGYSCFNCKAGLTNHASLT